MEINNKPTNINQYDYWESRYKNNWKSRGGCEQSTVFMKSLIANLPDEIKKDIKDKNLVDASCALGQGVDVLNKAFPDAIVEGVDFSDEAIRQCKKLYPQYNFYKELDKKYYCLFSSNTLEHFDSPLDVVKQYCNYSSKYIVLMIPYNEILGEVLGEHVSSFSDNSFPNKISKFKKIFTKVIQTEWWFGEQIICIYSKG